MKVKKEVYAPHISNGADDQRQRGVGVYTRPVLTCRNSPHGAVSGQPPSMNLKEIKSEYVLEVNSGIARKIGLVVGKKMFLK